MTSEISMPLLMISRRDKILTMCYRQLPHDMDYEKSIISAMLLDSGLCKQALKELEPYDFYNSANRVTFQTCRQLNKNGRPITIVTVVDLLIKKNQLQQVKANYLVFLIDSHPIATCINHYAAKLKDLTDIRRIIISANRAMNACFDYCGEIDSINECTARIVSARDRLSQRGIYNNGAKQDEVQSRIAVQLI